MGTTHDWCCPGDRQDSTPPANIHALGGGSADEASCRSGAGDMEYPQRPPWHCLCPTCAERSGRGNEGLFKKGDPDTSSVRSRCRLGWAVARSACQTPYWLSHGGKLFDQNHPYGASGETKRHCPPVKASHPWRSLVEKRRNRHGRPPSFPGRPCVRGRGEDDLRRSAAALPAPAGRRSSPARAVDFPASSNPPRDISSPSWGTVRQGHYDTAKPGGAGRRHHDRSSKMDRPARTDDPWRPTQL